MKMVVTPATTPTTAPAPTQSRAERRGNRAGAAPSFKSAPKDTRKRGGVNAITCGS